MAIPTIRAVLSTGLLPFLAAVTAVTAVRVSERAPIEGSAQGPAQASAQTSAQRPAHARHYPLETAEGLTLHNVSAVPTTHQGKKGLRITMSDEAIERAKTMTPEEQAKQATLAVLDGIEFGSGVIEAEIAGTPAPGAPEGSRGFVGINFRVSSDLRTYDTFYLRPTNGRADDQERRNHSAQYASAPDWPWFRLRKETPSKYEAYVDLQADVWTKIKIDVRGDRARLYIHDQEQPTLVINDVKSGASAKGAIALSADRSTVAHFRNLTVTLSQ
jgi:hypothetical protein